MTKENIFVNLVLRKDRIYDDWHSSQKISRLPDTHCSHPDFGTTSNRRAITINESWFISYDGQSDKSKKETPVVVTKVESADLDIYYPPKNLEFNHNINDDGVIGIDFKYIME